ncbi:MAG TPA: tetratricopeptide repeat protein [Gemmataceae bacterium]|nr:tetratricopeptide repeat protein [Gemmataceae bacterium]
MRRLNIRLLLLSIGLGIIFGSGIFSLHWLQSGRIAEAILRQAQKFEEEKNYPQSVKFLGRYLEFIPNDLEQRAQLGRLLAGEQFADSWKARESAFFNLEQVLTRQPERDDLRLLLVRVTMDLRRFEGAREHLDYLVKTRPEDGAVDRLFAQWHERQGKYAEAAEWFRKAIRHAPQQIDNYVRLAFLLRQRLDAGKKPEQRHEADQRVDEMVTKNLQSFEAYLARWRYRKTFFPLKEPAQLARAAADVHKALELAPREADVLLAAADLAQLQKDPEKVLAYLDQGIQQYSKDGRFYQALARQHRQSGQREAAIAALRKGLDAVPEKDQFPLLIDLVEGLIEGRDWTLAGELVSQLRNRKTSPALVDFLEGRVLLAQGRAAQAVKIFERVRAMWEAFPELARQVDQWLARGYAELDQPAQQLAALERVVRQEPFSIPARLNMAAAQVAAGRLDNAVDQYRQIMAMPDAPAGGWLELARLLTYRNLQTESSVANGSWVEVEDYLKKAEQAKPQSLEVALLRAEMLSARKQFDRAEELILQMKVGHIQEFKVWSALVAVAQREGKPDKARRRLEEAQQQLGETVEIQLAWIGFWAGFSGPQAEENLQKWIRNLNEVQKEDRPRFLNALAVAHYRRGKIAEAEELWDRLAQQPGFENNLPIRRLLFELAWQRSDDSKMLRRIEDLQKVEGEAGPTTRFCQITRLTWLGKQGNRLALAEAREILDSLTGQRPDWTPLYVARAEIEELKGNTDQALAQLRKAVALGERSTRVSIRLIQLLLSQKRFEEADREVRELQKQAPGSSALQRLGAGISLHTQDPNRAMELARQSVAADSKDYRDYLFLGQVLAATGQRAKEAEQQFRSAVDLAPFAPETWHSLIQHLVNTNQKDQAEETIRQAQTKLSPQSAPLALAQYSELVGRFDDAETYLKKALAENPHTIGGLLHAAGFYLRRGRAPEAAPFLRQILEPAAKASERELAWARRNLAIALSTQPGYSRFEEALALLGLGIDPGGSIVVREAQAGEEAVENQRLQARILAAHSGREFREKAIEIMEFLQSRRLLTPDDRLLLSQLYEAQQAWPKAREILRNLLADQGNNATLLHQYAQALLGHREIEEAQRIIEILEELEKKTKEEPGALGSVELRAMTLELKGQGPQAIALLKKFAGRKKARPEDELLLAGYLARQKKWEEAWTLIDHAGSTCPAETVAATILAILHTTEATDKHLRTAAEQWLIRALEKQPQSVPLHLHLADCYEVQEKSPGAEILYRRVLALDPHNLLALNNLAWSLALNGEKGPEALKLIDRALQFHGPQAALLDTRAVIYLGMEKDGPAIADAKKAVADAATALRQFHLARAYHQAGQSAAAQEALQQARHLGLDANRLHPSERPILQKMLQELVSAK